MFGLFYFPPHPIVLKSPRAKPMVDENTVIIIEGSFQSILKDYNTFLVSGKYLQDFHTFSFAFSKLARRLEIWNKESYTLGAVASAEGTKALSVIYIKQEAMDSRQCGTEKVARNHWSS